MSPTVFTRPPIQQVFVSVDDLEPPRPPGPEDPRPEAEPGAEAGPTGMAMVEQQSVEFDSPDSGLPSSRNYSMTSGIQSSIDEGQMGFEEDDGAGEESSAGMVPEAQASEPQEPGQEKASRAGELQPGEELAAVCAAAYTVCARSPGIALSGPRGRGRRGGLDCPGGEHWAPPSPGTPDSVLRGLGSLPALFAFIRASPLALDLPLRALHSSR